jgi:hypothetical protein
MIFECPSFLHISQQYRFEDPYVHKETKKMCFVLVAIVSLINLI